MNKTRTLVSDYFSLSLVQFSFYLIPFFVTPYIVRTISPNHYGMLELATNFVAYLTVVVSFGFDITGSRAILDAKTISEQSRIFYAIIGAKSLLFAASVLLSLPLIFIASPLHEIFVPIVINFIVLAASVITPVWYFQAVQRLPFFARTNLFAKIIYAIIVVATVKTNDTYLNIPLANAGTMLLFAVYVLWEAYRNMGRIVNVPDRIWMFQLLKEGMPFFLSSVMISLYTTTCMFVLGLYSSPTRVAFYSAAAKVITVSQAVVIMPIARLIFPVIGDTIRNDFQKGYKQIRQVLFVIIGLGGAVAVGLFFGARVIVIVMFGAEYEPSIPVLRILCIVPLAVGLSNLFGIQGLINMGFDRWLFWATVAGAIVGLLSNFLLTPMFQEVGAAGSLVIAEIVMAILTYGLFRRASRI
ncbi:MAG TPA: flippase [Bacteroidota bacterium]|nr:flippase [Bacteroidota bacterium]